MALKGALSGPPRINNFDVIRHLAALQVAVLHSTNHLGIQGIDTLREVATHLHGVPVFFTISGFLVYWSYDRAKDIPQYARNRFLRLYPGLWACLAVTLLLMALTGGLSLPPSVFALWALSQTTIFPIWTPDGLRPWGVGTPNGSLWTIIVELQFYAAVPLLHRLLKRGGARAAAAITVVALVCSAATPLLVHLPLVARKLWIVCLLPYLYNFLGGVLLYHWWNRAKGLVEGHVAKWAIVYFGYSLVMSGHFHMYRPEDIPSNLASMTGNILLMVVTISAAFSGSWGASTHRYDLSYGLYIYHMPIVNAFVAMAWAGKAQHVILALAASVALAAASWTLIERPALARKRAT